MFMLLLPNISGVTHAMGLTVSDKDELQCAYFVPRKGVQSVCSSTFLCLYNYFANVQNCHAEYLI